MTEILPEEERWDNQDMLDAELADTIEPLQAYRRRLYQQKLAREAPKVESGEPDAKD